MNVVERTKATFAFEPVDHLVRTCFYFWPQALERWKQEGLDEGFSGRVTAEEGEANPFHFDPSPWVGHGLDLGWVDAPFMPPYEEKVLESQGDIDIVQDRNGQIKKVIRGMVHGFMPTYLKNCVETREDWEQDVRPRLDPDTPERWTGFEEYIARTAPRVKAEEVLVTANVIGGYMVLRDLFGPEKLLYVFHDDPKLVHDCMTAWRHLMITCLTRVQMYMPFFRFYLAEDICYKSGPLISPEKVRTFLLPYYRDVVEELRSGQRERLYFEVDTDGNPEQLIPVYREIGMDAMSPFEVAAGCDVVKLGREYPDLVIRGGIDKRILAAGPEKIERELQRIMPVMVERGGFIPTSDHGVPHDVSLANYRYYRDRVVELDHR